MVSNLEYGKAGEALVVPILQNIRGFSPAVTDAKADKEYGIDLYVVTIDGRKVGFGVRNLRPHQRVFPNLGQISIRHRAKRGGVTEFHKLFGDHSNPRPDYLFHGFVAADNAEGLPEEIAEWSIWDVEGLREIVKENGNWFPGNPEVKPNGDGSEGVYPRTSLLMPAAKVWSPGHPAFPPSRGQLTLR